MGPLFESLTKAVEGSPLIALGASLLWGVLSVLLSPCHLASIPLIVGFISGQDEVSPRRAFAASSLFALGTLFTISVIGAATAGAGRIMGDLGSWTNWLAAAVFFLMGLHLLGIISLPMPDAAQVKVRQKGLAAAFALGAVFGLALGPCTFAFMAPVLAASARASGNNPILGGLLLAAYGIGHCAVIALAGGSVNLTQSLLKWSSESAASLWVKRGSGLCLLLGGLYLLSL